MVSINKFSLKTIPLEKLDSSKILYNRYYIEDANIYTIDVEYCKANLNYICSCFRIIAVVYDEETKHCKYTLAMNMPYGETTVTVEKSHFTSKNLEFLMRLGFSYNPEQAVEVLKFALLEEDNAKVITEYTYLGYKNDVFLGLPENDENVCTNRIRLDRSSSFSKQELNELIEKAKMLQLAIVISASSAIQSYLGQKLPFLTMVYHFYGDSSQGKTTALMANSVWGKPTVEAGLLSTWNQTELSLMNLLANNHGVTVALDESSICRFDLTSTLYNLSQGVNRQRLQKDLKHQPTKEWLTTILSSGESSLLEHANNNTGLKVRVIEFNDVVTLSAEHSNDCKTFFLENYGHIGVDMVNYINSFDFETWLESYNSKKEEFLAEVQKCDESPLTNRLADSFTLLLLTAHMLKELGYAVNEMDILTILLKKQKEIGKEYNVGRCILEKIRDRILNKRSLYPENKEFFKSSNIEGIICSNGEVMILESAFNKIVQENGFSSKLVCLRELDKIGALKKQRKDTFFSQRKINGISAKVLIINIDIDILKGEKYD